MLALQKYIKDPVTYDGLISNLSMLQCCRRYVNSLEMLSGFEFWFYPGWRGTYAVYYSLQLLGGGKKPYPTASHTTMRLHMISHSGPCCPVMHKRLGIVNALATWDVSNLKQVHRTHLYLKLRNLWADLSPSHGVTKRDPLVFTLISESSGKVPTSHWSKRTMSLSKSRAVVHLKHIWSYDPSYDHMMSSSRVVVDLKHIWSIIQSYDHMTLWAELSLLLIPPINRSIKHVSF